MRGFYLCCWLLTLAASSSAQEPTPPPIPAHMLLRLRNIKSNQQLVDELLRIDPQGATNNEGVKDIKKWIAGGNNTKVGRESSMEDEHVFDPRSGILTVAAKESLLANIPEAPLCEPRPMTLPVPLATSPSEFHWPSCVSVPRCGGCCSQGQACVPTRTEVVTFNILKMGFDARVGGMDVKDTIAFNFVRHKACACTCPVKRKHCNLKLHKYIELECRCKCKNEKSRVSCGENNKVWDNSKCKCACRNGPQECSRQEIFNEKLCRCESRRRAAGSTDEIIGGASSNKRVTVGVSETGTPAGCPTLPPQTTPKPQRTTRPKQLTWSERKQRCKTTMRCPQRYFGYPTSGSRSRTKPCYCRRKRIRSVDSW